MPRDKRAFTVRSDRPRLSGSGDDQRVLGPANEAFLERLTQAAGRTFAPSLHEAEAPQNSDLSRIKIAVYRTVRELFEQGQEAKISKLLEAIGYRRKTISFEQNPYNWCLQILKSKTKLLNRIEASTLNSIGWQLMHAHNHEIDHDMLIGFIYQTASTSLWKQKLIKRPGQIFYEPWFSEYKKRLVSAQPERTRQRIISRI